MSEEAPTFPPIDPSPYEFGIVTASYNQSLCDALLARVTEVLNFSGSPKEVIVERVPGSHEIPSLLKLMLEARPFHCLIGLGIITWSPIPLAMPSNPLRLSMAYPLSTGLS